MTPNPRFIVVNQPGVQDLGLNRCVVLADFAHFADLEQELDDWCSINGCARHGMVIDFPTESALMLFVMTWSS